LHGYGKFSAQINRDISCFNSFLPIFNPSFIRKIKQGKELQERTFSGSVRSHNPHNIIFLYREFFYIKDCPFIDFINDIIQKAKDAIEILRQIGGGAPNTVNVPGGVSFGANAGIQGFANGMDYVDRDRIVKVHRGEAILTADENEARMNGGNSTTNNISINLMGSYKNQSEANRDADLLLNALRSKGIELSRA